MRSTARRRTALALAALLFAAAASHAAVIYFKDGSKEMVVDRYKVVGDKIMAILPSGLETTIPLGDVDLEKTESMGKVAKGSAVVIDRSVPGTDSTPAQRARTVRDLMRERSELPTPVPLVQTVSRTLRKTPSGNLDYLNAPHREIGSGSRASAVEALLRRYRLGDATPYQGTTSNRVLLDIVTSSKNEVFDALTACAAVLLDLRQSEPGVEALEIAMATSARSRAGLFLLTPEQAEALKSGAVTPAEHFHTHVLF